MIKNLIVNGCSYTERPNTGWGSIVAEHTKPNVFHNLAMGGAGNFYIANSTIEYLEQAELDPSETLVLIMWSGTGRKDVRISGEWWFHLQQQYCRSYRGTQVTVLQYESFYLFSTGMSGEWHKFSLIKDVFQDMYKLTDPVCLCKDSLANFINLDNYLYRKGYQYAMTSFVNYWDESQESCAIGGDYSLAYFLKDTPMYKNFDRSHWFWINQQHDCLGEFAKNRNEFEDMHPTDAGYRAFAEEIVLPYLESNRFI